MLTRLQKLRMAYRQIGKLEQHPASRCYPNTPTPRSSHAVVSFFSRARARTQLRRDFSGFLKLHSASPIAPFIALAILFFAASAAHADVAFDQSCAAGSAGAVASLNVTSCSTAGGNELLLLAISVRQTNSITSVTGGPGGWTFVI